MLQEKPNVYQIPGEPSRQWFTDEFFELIIWKEHGEFVAFELSYDIQGNWRAIKWSLQKGSQHYRVNNGSGVAYRPEAVATLEIDHNFGKEQVQVLSHKFQAESQNIDADITHFVAYQMLHYDPDQPKR